MVLPPLPRQTQTPLPRARPRIQATLLHAPQPLRRAARRHDQVRSRRRECQLAVLGVYLGWRPRPIHSPLPKHRVQNRPHPADTAQWRPRSSAEQAAVDAEGGADSKVLAADNSHQIQNEARGQGVLG